ncbi:hypothetical protein E2542_SST26444 [Spatholobus suberectus]|nr:hypothetical protein E2542_SST26444 [Spatholobus suberectus]
MNVRKRRVNIRNLGKEAIPGCVHAYYMPMFYFNSCFHLPRMEAAGKGKHSKKVVVIIIIVVSVITIIVALYNVGKRMKKFRAYQTDNNLMVVGNGCDSGVWASMAVMEKGEDAKARGGGSRHGGLGKWLVVAFTM